MSASGIGLLTFALLAPFSVTLSQIALGLTLLMRSVELVRRPDCRRPETPVMLAVAAFAVATLASAALAGDRGTAFAEADELLSMAAFLLAVDRLRSPARARAALLLAIAAGSASAAWALVQMARHGVEYRVHGPLGHYMTFSGVTLLLLLAAVALAVHGAGRARVLAACAALPLGAALVATHTRSAWLGALAGAAVVALLARRRVWLVVLAVVVLLVYAVAPGPVRDRVGSIVDPYDPSNLERLYMWRAGGRMLADRPLLGVGPGNARGLWTGYRLEDDPSPPDRGLAHLHSNPVHLAAERGAVGLAAWIALWIAWVRVAWSACRARADPARALGVAALAAATGFHVAGLFEYNFGDTEVVLVLYLLMALPWAIRPVASAR